MPKSENKRDIAYGSLKRILVAAYCEYEKAGVQGLPSFDSLEDDIIQAMNVCGRHKVNGDSVPKGADEIYDYNIYVGGTMLGRGLTLKGLAITYIIRTAKGVSTVDTVQQRARWFGYKMKYLDLCRIFAVGKLLENSKKSETMKKISGKRYEQPNVKEQILKIWLEFLRSVMT